MGPFQELLAIDHRHALDFFVVRLQDVSEPDVDRRELLYNASVLAHYAQVSTQSAADLGTPETLSAVFDHFVADTTLLHDALMMETAAAQCLLLAGFFEDQMRGRHNIRWYAELGAGFFLLVQTLEHGVEHLVGGPGTEGEQQVALCPGDGQWLTDGSAALRNDAAKAEFPL